MNTLDEYLFEVKESSIPGAGKGVFTKYPIGNRQIVCECRGKFCKSDSKDVPLIGPRNIRYSEEFTIVGYDDDLAGFINDIIDFRQYSEDDIERYIRDGNLLTHPGKEYNCQIISGSRRVWIMAIKNIEAGEELFASYGDNYWLTRLRENGLFDRDIVQKVVNNMDLNNIE
jgi:hypothetical protein